MKYLLVLFAMCVFTAMKASAQSMARKRITVSFEKANLPTVLREISHLTGLNFLMDAECSKYTHPVTVKAYSYTLDSLLKNVFDQQPVAYVLTPGLLLILPRDVTGRVINAEGEPIASVTVSGAIRTILTNSKGEFILPNASCDDSITFSGVGVNTQTVKLRGRTTLIVKMNLKQEAQKIY